VRSDKKLREHTQFELISLQDKLGVTFLVVTHDQEKAMTLAEPGIGVHGSRGIRSSRERPPDIQFPSSKFVADFVGSVTFSKGNLLETTESCASGRRNWGATIYVSHGISAGTRGGGVGRGAARKNLHVGDATARPERRQRRRGTNRQRRPRHGAGHRLLGRLSIYLVKLPRQGRAVTQPNTSRHPRRSHGISRCICRGRSSPVVVTR